MAGTYCLVGFVQAKCTFLVVFRIAVDSKLFKQAGRKCGSGRSPLTLWLNESLAICM